MCIKSFKYLNRLHGDESGSISIATLFALLLLTMLLGMVINVGRQVDNKVKLQNAADAATYSGGVVLARGMNSLAFTNHMLCEVFAMTAIMREARDRHAEPLVPDILAAWDRIGPILASSGFEKFDNLGQAIPQKSPLEQEMVTRYSAWMAASSELVLPVLEEILTQELIPQFQRDVVQAIPQIAQNATARIAEDHTGRPSQRDMARGPIACMLWRTAVNSVGGTSESERTTLPVVDPQVETNLQSRAVSDRNRYAQHYLVLWNNVLMQPFDTEGKMSQFGPLWRGFTCGQLQQLISEYPDRNLPHYIREGIPEGDATVVNTWLAQDYQFVGVAYRRKMLPAMGRVFTDSLATDNQAFAQGMLFLPRRRPVDIGTYVDRYGEIYYAFIYNGAPRHWDLWNQNWSFQLVPATHESIPAILMQPTPTGFVTANASNQRLPSLGNVSPADIRRVTTH
jgi:hypothetical protein